MASFELTRSNLRRLSQDRVLVAFMGSRTQEYRESIEKGLSLGLTSKTIANLLLDWEFLKNSGHKEYKELHDFLIEWTPYRFGALFSLDPDYVYKASPHPTKRFFLEHLVVLGEFEDLGVELTPNRRVKFPIISWKQRSEWVEDELVYWGELDLIDELMKVYAKFSFGGEYDINVIATSRAEKTTYESANMELYFWCDSYHKALEAYTNYLSDTTDINKKNVVGQFLYTSQMSQQMIKKLSDFYSINIYQEKMRQLKAYPIASLLAENFGDSKKTPRLEIIEQAGKIINVFTTFSRYLLFRAGIGSDERNDKTLSCDDYIKSLKQFGISYNNNSTQLELMASREDYLTLHNVLEKLLLQVLDKIRAVGLDIPSPWREGKF